MGQNNPMYVKYFTYKVEFQECGAGHIHATLELYLKKLENSPRNVIKELGLVGLGWRSGSVISLLVPGADYF